MAVTKANLSRLMGKKDDETKPAMRVNLGYGKANFSSDLVTYAVMKVNAPFERITGITSGKRVPGSDVYTPAGTLDAHGALISCNVEHEQGTVLLLQVSWRRGMSAIREGALFFRLRPGAPLYSVSARVPTDRANRCGDRFCLFNGNADIMTVDELKLLGIEVPRSYEKRFMDIEELEEIFSIDQLTAETSARPQIAAIATPTGIEHREVPTEPARRLRLRGSRK